MSKRPTEEDFGLEPSADELASNAQPPQIEDEYRGSEEGDQLQQPTHDVQAEADKPVRERDDTGKFVKTEGERQKPPAPPPGYVDKNALSEARAEHRRTMEENRVLSERMTTLLETINARNAPKAEAPVIPDRNTDPLGYIDHMEQRLAGLEGESKSQREARESSERESHELNQVLAIAQPQFNEAIAADPTVQDTYNALLESVAREIMFVNRIDAATATPQQKAFLASELSKVENQHIAYAVKSGQNVAEYMRAFAASRGVTAAARQPNGQQVEQMRDPQRPAPRSITERLQAQSRHVSLSDVSGSAEPGRLDVKAIVRMSQNDFNSLAKSMSEVDMDKMMGRG